MVNDVDRLRRHAEARHEFVIGHDGFAFQPCPGYEVVKLNPKQNLAFVAQATGQTLSHGVEILLLLQRIAEQLAQLGVNGIWVVITQKAEAGVDLLLEQFAIHAGEGGEDLDQRRQEVGSLDDGAGFSLDSAKNVPAFRLEAGGESKRSFESALHATRARWRRSRFHFARS